MKRAKVVQDMIFKVFNPDMLIDNIINPIYY